MNEVFVVFIGSAFVGLAIALIVGGARSKVGKAGKRVSAVLGGGLLLAFSLLFLAFGLPKLTIPFLLPVSVVLAGGIGLLVGMGWGRHGSETHR